MYLTLENKKKLILISLFIFLATVSLIIGKTITSTLILTYYTTSILPYFYFFQAIFLMIVTFVSSKYLTTSQKKFAIVFKLIVLCSLILFVFLLQSKSIIIPFLISILITSYISMITLIAWNYAADIFDIQEFKRFSKLLQISSTVGAIAGGLVVALFSKKFHPTILLSLFFLFELTSFFLIKPLTKYLFLSSHTKKINANKTTIFKKSSIFNYLALMTMATFIISTLIDYNLKLELVATIDKQKIAYTLSLIFVLSTMGTLIVQLFFIDYFFRIFGSKKIIIIYPIAILIVSLVTITHVNFIFIAALFITNDIFSYTTSSLSRNLYLKILPQNRRILDRLKLNGSVVPLAIILSSLIVLAIKYVTYKSMVALIIIALLCIGSLYIARILIHLYRMELAQSLYLRRFNSDLINMSPMDNKDIDYLIEQTLTYPAPESILFGLQLLENNTSLDLPDSLKYLLINANNNIVKKVAKVLADRRNQHQFVNAAINAFSKSTDEETRWYLTLYLIDYDLDSFLCLSHELLIESNGASLAILCLIHLKQGDLDQKIKAMTSLLTMFHSQNTDIKKWFLYVLNETTGINKETYLLQLLNHHNPALKALVLQQVTASASDRLVNSIVSHIGEINIAHALNNCFSVIGERAIERIEDSFKKAKTYLVKLSCIRALSILLGEKSDDCLIRLIATTHDIVLQTAIAKYMAYRGINVKISDVLINFLIHQIKKDVAFYFQLANALPDYDNLLIHVEIKSRLHYIKERILYYAAAVVGSSDILNAIPLLTSQKNANQQAMTIELIDSTIENRKIALLLLSLFKDHKTNETIANIARDDPWLNQYIYDIENHNMNTIYTLTRLRKIDLFKDFAAETLQMLAKCCSSRDMSIGEIIFNEGDEGDGLYIIDSGEVSITKKGRLITNLSECHYFGELALLADIPRFATVTAISEGALFYIDKQDFDKITDELPDIIKNINKQVIKYLVSDFGRF